LGGAWIGLLVAWLIPLVPLFHIAALLQLLTEHTWVRRGAKASRATLAEVTHARFLGEAAPPAGLRGLRWLGAWARWWLRMIAIHGTARLGVVTGDLPNHDWHHRNPRGPWPMAAYERRDDPRHRNGLPEYTECWGLGAALDATFTALALLPRNATLGEPATYEEQKSAMLTM
jgi:hypothetical protein